MSSATAAAATGPPHRFSTFDVTSQVFLERTHALAVVNLKPIVPLHVLVITRKPYARLAEVPQEAVHELFDAVQEVSTVLQRLMGATSCTVAIQDGKEAGQSVPHLHVHILPRRKGDITPNDAIYAHLDEFGMSLHSDLLKQQQQRRRSQDDGDGDQSSGLAVDASEHRKPRSADQMEKEATWLREQLAKEEGGR